MRGTRLSSNGRHPEKRLVFWQPCVSPHQVPFLEELARIWQGKVVLVATEQLPTERRTLGWEEIRPENVEVLVAPSASTRDAVVTEAIGESVHVISGMEDAWLREELLRRCIGGGARVGIVAEGADPRGLRGLARRLKYLYRARSGYRRCDFLLAMGTQGAAWYESVGWPPAIVHEFMYVVAAKATAQRVERGGDGGVRLLYVGQLNRRKGLDVVIAALAFVPLAWPWELVVVGTGEEAGPLQKMVRATGIANRVRFLGPIASSAVRSEMARADLLLVPSRFDGWGAVVNEALATGTPVLCSDQCGAKDLLRADWRGDVVPVEAVAGWADAIERWLAKISSGAVDRERIASWMVEHATGEVVARHFIRVVAHVYGNSPRPTAPWLDERCVGGGD